MEDTEKAFIFASINRYMEDRKKDELKAKRKR